MFSVIGNFPSPTSTFRRMAPLNLGATARVDISLAVLGHREPVTHLAQRLGVSPKFCYQQAHKAAETLAETFAPRLPDEQTLFELPVTRQWIEQLVLSLILICHSSFRGAVEFLATMFDYRKMSVGGVHNLIRRAVTQAQRVNPSQNLSGIRIGAHDEIFQANQPVLVGIDVDSTFCYLLQAAEHRDETTWGYYLLQLQERGLNLDHTIADGGRGLRAGQAAAWPGVPCHADVFHAEYQLGQIVCYLENRATGCTKAAEVLQRKLDRSRQEGTREKLTRELASAQREQANAIALARDVRLLADWLQKDVLAAAGPSRAIRRELFDFIVQELEQREGLCPHRIQPVRKMFQGQRDDLLAFAGQLDTRLAQVALDLEVPEYLVRAVCQLQAGDENTCIYWQQEARLRKKLRDRFDPVRVAVQEAITRTPRASSLVENRNSCLRNYFFLRRQIGNDYLDLLRFYLNHHRYLRSDRPERVGKSPAELLNGKPHPHWLELLGYRRFERN
jgi:hypothetical protein